jgi:hypothetical protein
MLVTHWLRLLQTKTAWQDRSRDRAAFACWNSHKNCLGPVRHTPFFAGPLAPAYARIQPRTMRHHWRPRQALK